MKILGICASYGLHVCIIDNEKLLFSHSREDELKSDNLLEIIDEGLKFCKLELKDIDVIATCVGPGSFTGSRVAISLVKGLFIGQNKKLVSFEAFDAYDFGDAILSGFGNFVYIRQAGKKACVELSSVGNFKGVTDSENIASKLSIKKATFNMLPIIIQKVKNKEFISIEELMPVYLRASQAEIDRSKKNDRR